MNQTHDNSINEPHYYLIDDQAEHLGVKFLVSLVRGIQVSTDKLPPLVNQLSEVADWASKLDIDNDSILLGYRQLLSSVRAETEKASPEALIDFIKKRHRFPQINSVVDSYNVISVSSRIVVSAHDLDRCSGIPLIFMANGNEKFYPLGSTQPIIIPKGQWGAAVDNHILCQLNCKQSELSKVTNETKNLLIYVQGSPATSDAYLQDVLAKVCENIVLFNGGHWIALSKGSS